MITRYFKRKVQVLPAVKNFCSAAVEPATSPLTFATAHETLEDGWKTALSKWLSPKYLEKVQKKVQKQADMGFQIFPPPSLLYRAFQLTPIEKVKVVIIGQAPYFSEGQADGLCFSVPRGIELPFAVRNIYKELERTIPAFKAPKHGDLSEWAQQGVLLINSVLTVRVKETDSHAVIGWSKVTEAVLRILNRKHKGLVVMAWGKYAKKRAKKFIDRNIHSVLEGAHPMSLSASDSFLGCRHFTTANDILKKQGKEPIDWCISE